MILHGNSIIYANFIPCTENNSLLSSIFKDKYKIQETAKHATIFFKTDAKKDFFLNEKTIE
mgnify:CR=1 FL=1